VSVVTIVALLRLRFKLSVATNRSPLPFLTLAEETGTLAFDDLSDPASQPIVAGDAAHLLLAISANANLADIARDRHIAKARSFLDCALPLSIAQFAKERAVILQQDHIRVREASRASRLHITVEPVLPPDIIGFFTLLPSQAASSSQGVN
jgi:hypothetical protein